MADYDVLDEATLKQMLSDATSYEDRAALRQALRKQKKERGETTGRAKPRGNSVYNRFAGSTATKSTTKSAGANILPASNQPKQGVTSPTPKSVSRSPVQPQSPVQQPVLPTPTPPPSPEIPAPTSQSPTEQSESHDETDVTPATVEPAEFEEVGTEPEEAPQENVEEENEEPILDTKKEISPAEHDHSTTVEPPYDSTDSKEQTSNMSSRGGDLHAYLVAYVNQTLFLDPPLPSRGKALYDTCSDPTLLCKLINKSVAGTVDLRALSKIAGSAAQRAEAVQDNMTLVIESARAIGCQITDSTQDKMLHKEPETIDNFLLDLIRARVVHMPGMEDEPASTFSDMQTLFQKLHISVDEEEESKPVSWRDDRDKVRKALQANSPTTKGGSWKEGQSDTTDLTYEQRAALRKAEREQRQKEKEAGANSVELTYEERAAQRRADRERRRKEREALAK